MTQDTPRTWMLRFTAAAAMIMFVAAPVSAQLGGVGTTELALPLPAAPDAPLTADLDAPGAAADVAGRHVTACADTSEAAAAARDAHAGLEATMRALAGPLAPVTEASDAAKAELESAAAPVTSHLPEPDTDLQACVDGNDPAASAEQASGQVEGKASGLLAQLRSALQGIVGKLPF